MYYLVLKLVPFLDKWSFKISIALFVIWLFQTKSKVYLGYLQEKAQSRYKDKYSKIVKYNYLNPDHQIQITSGWLDLYKHYLSRRNNTLLLSFIFAYVSFNTTSFFENNNENFFKLLTISTTLFLAGLTYLQQLNRE